MSTPKPAHAATWWWNSLTTGLWTNGSNWSNAANGGTTGTAPTNDTTTDVVVFNTTGTNGAVVAQLSQDQSIGGITVANTGATTIRSDTTTTRSFTIGAGGITINSGAGAFTIGATGSAVNVAIAGSQSWTNNSSNTFAVAGGITSSAAGLQTLSIAGSGNTTLSGIVGDGSGTVALTKSGNGTLTLTAANTYSGTTTILGGSFTLNGSGGRLQNTAAVNVAGNATFNLGDSTAGNGLADRINTGAALTLGGASGAGFLAVVRGSTTANSQTFSSLSVGGGGLSTISSATSTGGAPTVTFNGANPYQRSVAGGVVNINTANVNVVFGATAPSGAGNVAGTGTDAILVGATLNSSDLIAATTGGVAAASYYSTTTGGNTAANYAGKNVSATAAVTLSAAMTPNSIRFADATSRTLTLTGSNVIGSGMVVQASSGAAGTITGGTIATGNGRDLIIVNTLGTDRRSNANGSLTIASVVSGSGGLTLAGNNSYGNGGDLTVLSGVNTFSGAVALNGAGVRVAANAAFGDAANAIVVNGTSGITNTAAFTLPRSITLGNASQLFLMNSGNLITLSGSISGGDAASVLNIGSTHGPGNGQHRVSITGTNTMLGTIRIYNQLRAYEGAGLSPNANVMIGDASGGSANAPDTSAILETSGTFTRSLGSAAGEFRWDSAAAGYGAGGGFSAVGGPLAVAFGGTTSPTALTWGSTTGFLASGAELRLQNANATDAVALSNAVNLNGAQRTVYVGNSANAAGLTGLLSGDAASGIIKTGPGILELTGTNTFGGKVSIRNGSVRIAAVGIAGANGNLGTNGTIDIGSAATAGTLVYTGAGETTDRVINLAGTSGGATLTQSGSSGSLKFTAALTATGSGAKTLALQGSTAATGEIAGAIVDYTGAGGPLATAITKAGTGTWTLSGANSYTGVTTVNGGVLAVTNLANGGSTSGIGASSSVASNLVLGGGSLQYTGATVTTDRSFTLTASTTSTIDVATAATTLTFTGSTASTTGGLAKAGAGTLALAGPAAYTGSTTVNSGTLQIGNSGTTGSLSTSSAITGSAGATLAFSRTNTVASGTDFASTIGGSLNVAQLGSGTLVFSGANTYTGTTTLSAGSILLSNTNAVQNSTVAVGAGSLLFDASVTGNSFVLGALSGTGGINLRNNAGTPASIALTAGGNSASTTYQGVITSGGTGSSTFTKWGSGTLTLDPGAGQSSSVGAFSVATGGVRLASGTLSVTAASSLRVGGANAPTFTLDGGQLLTSSGSPLIGGDFGGRGTFTLTTGTWTNTGSFISIKFGATGDGSVMNVNGGLVDSSRIQLGQNGGTSTLNLNGGVAAVDYLFNTNLPTSVLNLNGGILRAKSSQANFIDLTSGSTSTVNVLAGGAIIDTNSFNSTILMPLRSGTTNDGGLTKQGAGTLTLSATNTFTGATSINVGTLAFDRIAALATTSGITIGSGAGLTYTGAAGSLDRNVAVSSGTGTVRNTGSGMLTLSGTLTKNGSVLRFNTGTFTVSGLITGANANSDLVVDAATVTLTNSNNDYNGPTFVQNGGTLILGANNVISSTSAVTVDASTLTVGGFTDTIQSLTTAGNATINVTASGGSSGGLTMGNLALGAGTDTLGLTMTSPTAGRYTLLTYTGSRSGTFDSVTGLNSNYNVVYGGASNSSVDLQMKASIGTVSATTANTRIIVGGSTAISYTVANTSPTGAATLSFQSGSNSATVVGASSGSALANQTSASVSGLTFTSSTVGLGQTGSFTVTDPDAITTTGNGSVTVDVLNHSLASFAGIDAASRTLDFGTFDVNASTWSGGDGGSGTIGYSLFNIASGGFTNAQTAGLDLYDWSFTGDAIFAPGLSQFQNLASGTSTDFVASVTSPGALVPGNYSATFTLRFRDQNLPGATNTRHLTLTTNVIVVPEPGAFTLAGIAVGLAGGITASRRRASRR